MRVQSHRAHEGDLDPVHLSPYGPAARMKRRNEEAGYTTEPNRFAPNPPQKPLAFSWASIYGHAGPPLQKAQILIHQGFFNRPDKGG